MARDKAKDDKFFRCSQEHELKYVSGLYSDVHKVLVFLDEKCENGDIKYLTHEKLYELIRDELGFEIPN